MTGAGHVTRLAALAGLTLALASCGSADEERAMPPPPPANAADFPNPDGKTLEELRADLPEGGPVLAPSVSVLEPGTNRIGFGLFDRARRQIADAPISLYIAPVDGGKVQGPFPARYESLAVKPQFQSRGTNSDPDAAQSVYVADLPLKKAGDYQVLGVVALDGRLVAAEPAGPPLEVTSKSKVPDVGDPAPRISTPTEESVGGDIAQIDTRVPPSDMHEVDFADVVGEKPVMLLFATPALCQSRVCGPVVDVAEEVKAANEGQADWIHMEIYNDNELEKGFRPQVRAFDLPTEPWLFAIDREGRVAARIEGAFSAREAQQALEAATKGAERS